MKVGAEPVALASGDYDGDGLSDVAVANWRSGEVVYLRGGTDGLAPGWSFVLGKGSFPSALASGDYNGDGFLDVAVATFGSGEVTCFLGGPRGLTPAENSITVGVSPLGMVSGDYDTDGFLDVVVANSKSADITYLRGGLSGLSRGLQIPAAFGSRALASGDYDGDGFLDVVVAAGESATITYFRGRFLNSHANTLVDPEGRATLADPRFPPRYCLELPAGAFPSVTQVCLVPRIPFELPQAEAAERGKYLRVVADPVAILRETTRIQGSARLTLRLRNDSPPSLETLRIFHKFPQAEREVIEELEPEDVEIVRLQEDTPGEGHGVSFSICRFGTYLVVMESDRETNSP